MSEMNPPEEIVYLVHAGECTGGPLDGSGFWFQIPADFDMGRIHVNIAVNDHVHCYAYDAESSGGLSIGLTYRGRMA